MNLQCNSKFFMHSEGRRQAAKPWCGGRHRVQRGGAAPTWTFCMKLTHATLLVDMAACLSC